MEKFKVTEATEIELDGFSFKLDDGVIKAYDQDGYFLGDIYSEDYRKDWNLICSGQNPIYEHWEDGLGHILSIDGWFGEQIARKELLDEIYRKYFSSCSEEELLRNYAYFELNETMQLDNDGLITFKFMWRPNELFEDNSAHEELIEMIASEGENDNFYNFCKENAKTIRVSFDLQFDEECKLYFEDLNNEFDHTNKKKAEHERSL